MHIHDFQHYIPQLLLALGRFKADLLAHHHAGKLFCVGFTGQNRSNHLAQMQDGDNFADLHDLVKLMADEDHGLVLRNQIADGDEQLPCFLRSQHGGRLIQHQQVALFIQRLDNLHALLLSHSQCRHLCIGIHRKAVFLRNLLNVGSNPLFVNKCLLLIQTQNHILYHRQGGDEHEVLVHHANAAGDGGLWGIDLYHLAVHSDGSAVRLGKAIEHIHQCALAGTVFAQQGVDLPTLKADRDLIAGNCARINFGNVF